MKTIILKEQNDNGKANILDYPIYFIPTITIQNQKLVCNKKDILQNVKKVIFDYNEDLLFFTKKFYKTKINFISHLVKISNIIHQNYKNIIIYNDPKIGFILGDKFLTYEMLHKHQFNDPFLKIPTYLNFNKNFNDLKNIDFYPVICKDNISSNSKKNFIANNFNELQNNLQKNKNIPYLISQYINSFDKKFNCYHMIRLFVFNDILIDIFYRPSKKKFINVYDNTVSKELIEKSNIYYEKHIQNINLKNTLHKLYKILGKGFYTYDLIYFNENFYLCEIGYKFSFPAITEFFRKNKISSSNVSLDKAKLKNKLKELIKND